MKTAFQTLNVNGAWRLQSSVVNILKESYALPGDMAISKNLPEAHSVPSRVNRTSKDHFMVAVIIPQLTEPGMDANSSWLHEPLQPSDINTEPNQQQENEQNPQQHHQQQLQQQQQQQLKQQNERPLKRCNAMHVAGAAAAIATLERLHDQQQLQQQQQQYQQQPQHRCHQQHGPQKEQETAHRQRVLARITHERDEDRMTWAGCLI